MSRLLATSRRLAFGLAAIALVASWTASGARADIAYAYAEQTISGLTATNLAGAFDVTVVRVTPQSATFANLNNVLSGDNTNTLNAREAFVPGGLNAGPGDNSFVKYATFLHDPAPASAGDLPLTPAFSFSRGDVVLTAAIGPGARGQAVAESYLKGAGQVASAEGHNNIGYDVRVATAGVHHINFDFANDLYAVTNTAPGVDTASGQVAFTITITGGGYNFSVTGLDRLNVGTGIAAPNNPETLDSGHLVVDTPALAIGTTYRVTFELDARTLVTTAVPEPATMAMALTALPLVGFGLLRRRNRKTRA